MKKVLENLPMMIGFILLMAVLAVLFLSFCGIKVTKNPEIVKEFKEYRLAELVDEFKFSNIVIEGIMVGNSSKPNIYIDNEGNVSTKRGYLGNLNDNDYYIETKYQ